MPTRLVTAFVALLAISGTALPATPKQSDPLSVSKFVSLGLMSRLEAFGELCTEVAPNTGGDWDKALGRLRATIAELTQKHLSSDAYRDLKDAVIPEGAAPNLLKALDGAKQELRDKLLKDEPAKKCAGYLEGYQQIDGDYLDAGIMQSLAGVRTLIKGLEKGYIQ